MDSYVIDVDINGFQEKGRMSQKYAQNAKVLTGIFQERKKGNKKTIKRVEQLKNELEQPFFYHMFQPLFNFLPLHSSRFG
jgi:hypothetical protein